MREITVHIEEVVLHDPPPDNHHQMAAALEQELSGLLAWRSASPLLSRSGAIARVDAGSIGLHEAHRPAALGAGIARAVHQGLMR
jgi:hypothetical protein